MTTDSEDLTEMTVPELSRALHEHLEATAEMPIDATANRWLGEAQAAAADVADGAAPPAVIAKRARQVEHLLESAGDTDNAAATRRVEAALATAREIRDRLEA